MKNIKQILSVITIFAVVFAFLPFAAYAEGDGANATLTSVVTYDGISTAPGEIVPIPLPVPVVRQGINGVHLALETLYDPDTNFFLVEAIVQNNSKDVFYLKRDTLTVTTNLSCYRGCDNSNPTWTEIPTGSLTPYDELPASSIRTLKYFKMESAPKPGVYSFSVVLQGYGHPMDSVEEIPVSMQASKMFRIPSKTVEREIAEGIATVNSNIVSTQAAVQDVKSVVTSGHQSLDAHLTRQDATLNNIYSYVKKAYTYAYNAYNYAVKIFNLLMQVYNLLIQP